MKLHFYSYVRKLSNGKWGIISHKTGKLLPGQRHDTKKQAEKALQAIHINSDGDITSNVIEIESYGDGTVEARFPSNSYGLPTNTNRITVQALERMLKDPPGWEGPPLFSALSPEDVEWLETEYGLWDLDLSSKEGIQRVL